MKIAICLRQKCAICVQKFLYLISMTLRDVEPNKSVPFVCVCV